MKRWIVMTNAGISGLGMKTSSESSKEILKCVAAKVWKFGVRLKLKKPIAGCKNVDTFYISNIQLPALKIGWQRAVSVLRLCPARAQALKFQSIPFPIPSPLEIC